MKRRRFIQHAGVSTFAAAKLFAAEDSGNTARLDRDLLKDRNVNRSTVVLSAWRHLRQSATGGSGRDRYS